jgi:hypothetical protein
VALRDTFDSVYVFRKTSLAGQCAYERGTWLRSTTVEGRGIVIGRMLRRTEASIGGNGVQAVPNTSQGRVSRQQERLGSAGIT